MPRPRPARTATGLAAATLLVVVSGLAGACSSGGSGGASEPATTEVPASTSTTTTDPLAGPVVDGCGNDLSQLTSSVLGIDVATGAVRWTVAVPLASGFLLTDASGDPRLSLVLRPVEMVLDPATGATVGTPVAGAHEVLVDTADATGSGVGGLLVDGESQPAEIEVGGLRITTAAGETGQTTLGLTATDAATSAPAWRADLGAADAVATLSPPVAYGDTVVVVTSPPQPTCP